MRIALLTMEALASAEPVRRFVASDPGRIALVALSDPHRGEKGGMIGQTWRLLRRSGPRLIPYLIANFELPRLAGWLRPADRRPELIPMAALCARLGIPVEIVPDMNGDAFHDRLIASGADILVTFHCDQILAPPTIELLVLGGLNVHAGLLPDHRGPTPTIHALLEEQPRFGVTIHRLSPRIDAGPILARREVDLPSGITALEAAIRLHEFAVPMLADVLGSVARGTAVEQAVTSAPYRGFPTRREMRALASKGRRAASWRDIGRALRTPV